MNIIPLCGGEASSSGPIVVPVEEWITGTAYPVGQILSYYGNLYIVLQDHTSSSTITDVNAGNLAILQLNDGVVRPELFGAKGDGINDDGPAMKQASLAVSLSGGVYECFPGRTYWVGTQLPNAVGGPESGGTIYTFGPETWVAIDIRDAVKPVHVRGNGARIKCLPGKKFGSFDEGGNSIVTSNNFYGNPGVVGRNIASPYYAMVSIANCSAEVTVENLELDGSVGDHIVGGQWGDTGWQVPATGIQTYNNTGPITVRNINSHHHALDGGSVAGTLLKRSDHKALGLLENCRFEFNRRQGISYIGGKGWTFTNCAFNYTGKTTRNADTLASFHSSPGAGVDIEPEQGFADDIIFDNCEFIANVGAGLLGAGLVDGNGVPKAGRVVARCSTFVGSTAYGVYDARNFTFDNCKFVGTIVWQGGTEGYSQSTVTRESASNFIRCSFYNAGAESPTGAAYSATGTFVENAGYGVIFSRCTFVHNHAGFSAAGTNSADANHGPMYDHCEFIVKQGQFGPIGRLVGSAFLREMGSGTFTSFPNAPHQGSGYEGRDFSGIAECNWWHFKADGTVTERIPTLDSTGCYRGTGTVGDGDFTIVNAPDQPPYGSAYGLATIRITVGLSANRTVTLSTVSATHGMRRRFTRAASSTGAFTWAIGTLKNLTTGQWCEIEYDGVAAAWKLIAFGSL